MNTIGDMQNEKDYAHHYKMFVYNQDFVKFYKKIDKTNIFIVWSE